MQQCSEAVALHKPDHMSLIVSSRMAAWLGAACALVVRTGSRAVDDPYP